MPRQYVRHVDSKAILEREERYTHIQHLLDEGKTQMEIADILGVSRQNINQQVNRPKYLARRKVMIALKRGYLVKPDKCIECNDFAPEHAHHEDYSKPLEVMWLCSICHGKVHKNGWSERQAKQA